MLRIVILYMIVVSIFLALLITFTFEAGARVRAKVSNVLLLETIESEHF